MRILGRFCREHIKDICLYAGFAGVFIVVFYLYNIELEAVKYGFLLTFVWVLVYGVAGFIRLYGRHRALVETEQKIITELEGMPAPGTLIEEDYQNILRRLYEDKLEIESDMRISRAGDERIVPACGWIRDQDAYRRYADTAPVLGRGRR